MSRCHFLRDSLVAVIAFSALSRPILAEPVPEELLDDPHFRSEFGLNDVTTPSIRQVFAVVKNLAPLSRESLQPSIINRSTPVDRSAIALSLGGLIAEGFFLVQSHQSSDLEVLAKSIAGHCTALGTGDRVTRHAKALLEEAGRGSWEALENELAATQREVEGELVALRDVGAVHLISLGGWIRAFEIAANQLKSEFSPERAEMLRRIEVVDYFLDSLQYLDPTVQELPWIRDVRTEVGHLLALLKDLPQPCDAASAAKLQSTAAKLSIIAFHAK
jgi:hypothetical protein